MKGSAEFDRYAEDYDAVLAKGLSITGEDGKYFARRRITWLAECLRQRQEQPRRVLDFGCGTGAATSILFELMGIETLVGVDLSPKSIEVAVQTHGSKRARFVVLNQYQPAEAIDLVFCNGVFHHIQPHARAAAIDFVYRTLRPGGLFALWENNPWNPGARYVMHRCPFDAGAIPLTPPETRALLLDGGFEILRTDFLFIFPRLLSWLRGLERVLSRLPFGAQYQLIARKHSQ